MTNVRWRLVSLLLIANMINYIDRVNLSFAAPHFMQLLHIGPGEMGIVLSAFLWTYFLLQVPSGMVLDRWGVRFVFGGTAVLWGAATMLTATITSATSLLFWRVLLGVGEAPSAPAGTKVLSQWLPDHQRGLAGSLNVAGGIPLGVFVGSPLISWLLTAYSWQMVFIVTGLLAVFWGIGWIAYYRLPERHGGANAAERNHILANNSRLTRGDVPQQASWGQLLSNRNVLGLALGHAALLFNLYFFDHLAVDLFDRAAPHDDDPYRHLWFDPLAVRPGRRAGWRCGLRSPCPAGMAAHECPQGVPGPRHDPQHGRAGLGLHRNHRLDGCLADAAGGAAHIGVSVAGGTSVVGDPR